MAEELIEKFNLTRNSNGLFDEIIYYNKIIKYLNDENTGLEPVPWFIVRVNTYK